jgi:hypothetical protein
MLRLERNANCRVSEATVVTTQHSRGTAAASGPSQLLLQTSTAQRPALAPPPVAFVVAGSVALGAATALALFKMVSGSPLSTAKPVTSLFDWRSVNAVSAAHPQSGQPE